MGSLPAEGQTAQADGTSRFAVILRGVRIGSELVDVSRSAGTFKITSSGQLAPPFDLVTTKFEMSYSADWQPQQLSIEGLLRGQLITLSTTFGVTTATSEMMQGGQRGSVTRQISPRAIVIPNNFFGAYEALAARLGSAAPGSRLPAFVAPDAEMSITVERMTPRRIVSPAGSFELRQYDVTLGGPSGPVAMQVWIDERGRLARVAQPASSLLVIRDDLASVMAREESIRNAGDEDVFIPASGFSLGATVTKPAAATGRLPAVVLVGGPGRQGRDETLYGVPMFGQIAGKLADAGYFVARYDRRGVGQSGGRTEHASLSEYADDLVAVVNWLRRRKDIDADRIAVVGHSEGAVVALAAADREKRIKALGLMAAAGRSGREVTIEQQRHLLSQMNEPEADKQAKIALQMRVIDAAVSGKGWETVPPDVRRQADSPWFRSWLVFDPAEALKKVKQPVLIVQGALDTEIPTAHANRLEELSRSRKNLPATHTRKVIVPGVNHLLVSAVTGEADEYDGLPVKVVVPEVTTALVEWLKSVLSPGSR